MKKHFFTIVAIAAAMSSCGPTYVVQRNPPPPPPQQPVEEAPEVTYQTFYDDLSPYGQWIDYPEYGYVWMPNTGPDFKPYATNGQWVYTEDGWTWSSGYNWGWATFHYGRWFFDPNYGWMWIPGYQWAPAWVSWRQSPDYYGWAPLGPNVTVGVAVSSYNPPPNYWSFVPHQYVASPRITNYYVSETKNVTIINNTTVINNTTIVNNNRTTINNNTVNNTTINNTVNNNVRNNFVVGPDPHEVSRYTGTTVTPAVIRQSSAPGEQLNNGQLNLYRPRVNAAPSATGNSAAIGNAPRPAPTRVVPLSNARPMINRPATTEQNNAGQVNRPTNAEPNNNNQFNRPNNPVTPSNSVRQETPISNPTTTPAQPNGRPNNFNNTNNQQAVSNPNPSNGNVRTSTNQPVRATMPVTTPPANTSAGNPGNNPSRPPNSINPNQQAVTVQQKNADNTNQNNRFNRQQKPSNQPANPKPKPKPKPKDAPKDKDKNSNN